MAFSIFDISKMMLVYPQSCLKPQIKSQYLRTIEKCKSAVDNSIVFTLNSNCDIPSYLQKLHILKTAEYSLEMRLLDLFIRRYALSIKCINLSARYNENDLFIKLLEAKKRIEEIKKENPFSLQEDLSGLLGIEKPIKPGKPKKFELLKPSEPHYEKPGLFNKKSVLENNERLKRQYETDLENFNIQKSQYDFEVSDYQERMNEYKELERLYLAKREEYESEAKRKWEEDLAANNEEYRALIKCREYYSWGTQNYEEYKKEQIKNSLPAKETEINEEEIIRCEEMLTNAYQSTHDYLSVNILFPKYSTLPAVSTIYEYFISGRCDELTGANGAYNLYESEIRADRIIEQLDNISDKLDTIAKNQYLLYQSVTSVNSELSKLNTATNNIDKELKNTNSLLSDINETASVIAYNTAATAYYSKLNTELTDSLGFLVGLK